MSSDDGGGLSIVEFPAGQTVPRSRRSWWYVAAAGALVVIGMTVGITLFNTSSDNRRGATSAVDAAQHYVRALNAGDTRSAVGISCAAFADRARADARSGREGVRFALDSVRSSGTNTATAAITARLRVGGQTQAQPAGVKIVRGSGLWLVCGESS